MEKARRILCLLLAAGLCAALAACGSKQETASETTTETTAAAADRAADSEDSEEDDDSDDDAPIDLDQVTVKGKETTPAETTAPVQTTAATTAATDSAGTAKSTSAAKETAAPTEGLTDPAPEADAPADEKTVAGIIDLGSGSFEGEGISVDGSTIRITGGGTYILSGSRSGMVEVNTTEKVKLKLNGVNLNNPDGPAILCTDAKRLTLTLIEGTYNELTDGGSAHDGAITSNDTLEIKGAGTLRVNGNVGHGISSDDDIVIKNGDITVNAVKSALMANDDITVSGGYLHATGRTNGVKSKGTVHVSGGVIWAVGGPKETKSALFSGGAFTLTGGCIYAIGCGASEPDGGSSTQRCIVARFQPSLGEGSTAAVYGNGSQLMRESSPYAFNTVFVSTPDIYDGMEFTIQANDEQYGETYTVSGVTTGVVVEKAADAQDNPQE